MKANVLVLAAAAAALLAGCGSPTDSVTFQVPPGFHPRASFGPFMQIWESSPHQMLTLFAFPVQVDFKKALQQSDVKDARVEKMQHVTICNGQDAMFTTAQGQIVTREGQTRKATPSEIEFLMTNIKGRTFMAAYLRPLHDKADPAAESAIKNLCPK